jgi:hypothetical protein
MEGFQDETPHLLSPAVYFVNDTYYLIRVIGGQLPLTMQVLILLPDAVEWMSDSLLFDISEHSTALRTASNPTIAKWQNEERKIS